MRADLGRGFSGAGADAGDGDCEFLANGLFRHRGPLGAGALMVVLYLWVSGQVRWGYLHASARRILRSKNDSNKQKQRLFEAPITTIYKVAATGRRREAAAPAAA
jgi:hypothetical protein